MHYIQTFLNPLYKNLAKIGVKRTKVSEIHLLIDDLVEGLYEEFPDLLSGNENDSENKDDEKKAIDSDDELYILQTQRIRGPSERVRWLKYKSDPVELRSLKLDSTPFWEGIGKELFPGLGLLYYRTATKHASEALIERFFSAAGYITAARRARAGIALTKATTMRHLWKM